MLRWAILVALLVVVAGVSSELINHPAVVQADSGATWVYLLLFAVVVAVYAWFALFRTRATGLPAQNALQVGTRWGLACGGAWLVEVLIANVWGAQLGPLNIPLYYAATLAGFLLPGLAALRAACQNGGLVAGVQAGLLSGMLGALILFLAAIAIPALILGVQPDVQTLGEFQRSGVADLQIFLVSDLLAALIAHLWIGLVTGLLFGLAGAAVGKALAGYAPLERS